MKKSILGQGSSQAGEGFKQLSGIGKAFSSNKKTLKRLSSRK